MVTYQLEWRTPQRSGWEPYGPPADSVTACTHAAAHSARMRGEQFRVVGLSTEIQPDGTIVRRELSPEELEAAIRGEQVPTKHVKAVVVVWDEECEREAVYVDGQLVMDTDLTHDDELDTNGLETIAAGQPITIKACQMERHIEVWPDELAALQLDD